MRNLSVARFSETSVNDEDGKLSATAWDTSNDSIICAFGPTSAESTIELKRKWQTCQQNKSSYGSTEPVFSTITSWDSPCPLPDFDSDEILLMHYFPDIATTSIVLAGGDLVLVREDPRPGQEAIEIVGSIDVGIAAAAWAPDEEILAIVTQADNLVLMSRYLEPLNEVKMAAEDLESSRHVSVGWGKKETQFQGKRAKALRDPTLPEHVDQGLLSPFENNATVMSWRGDGAFIAINSITNSRRVIRVYSREGILDSISEPVDGLEAALSWRPSGNLIASVKRSMSASQAGGLQVVFFERNGLRHGEFDLRFQPLEATQGAVYVGLAWNVDSSVLAINYLNSVQFWTMSNYHWYLKQDIKLPTLTGGAFVSIKWHPENPLKCSVATCNTILELEFDLLVLRGSTCSPFDSGTVAVVDGSLLKLTPMKQAGIPPPMAFCEINAGENIVDCALSKSNEIIAVLTQKSLVLYKWKSIYTQNRRGQRENRFTADITEEKRYEDTQLVGNYRNGGKLCLSDTDKLYVLYPAQHKKAAGCYCIDTVSSSATIVTIEVPHFAQILLSDLQQSTVWVSDEISTVMLEPSSGKGTTTMKLDNGYAKKSIFKLPLQQDLHFENIDSSSFHHSYQTSKGALYTDGQLITRDCTSFVVTETYLVFTTSQNLLKFVHLVNGGEMQVPGDMPEADERCRAVEKGAKIVTVIPSTYAVILQMPRGNLETICPRILVLTGIRKSLENRDYLPAFLACQVHQVDMNILCDHRASLFMANIVKFVDELIKPSRIDEFLSKLKEQDVTETLYKDTLIAFGTSTFHETNGKDVAAADTKNLAGKAGKANQICDAFISVLNTKGSKYLQNIITAHVCKRPPDLTAALMLVSSLKNNSAEEADIAISHLCFLTDTNRLYDAALSLYDLELTLLVAQNAQRDPREYMPFLESLRALPALRRQYQIDNYLKRYSKALVALHSLQAHKELQAYMIKHTLYITALNLYMFDTEHIPKITILYAEYLESQSQYSSAATLYESLGKYEFAYPLYALSHQWRESLTCASLVPLEHSKLLTLAASLATTCSEVTRDYRSAATIYLDYLQDIPGAARLLCKGSYFADAARVLALHNLSSEINTILDPALTEKFGEIIELMSDCKSQLAAQIPRIAELRKKKEEDPLGFYGGDPIAMGADGVDIPDNVSLAPTAATTAGGQSLFTRYGSNASKFGGTVASNVSRKTSKTKRREERKRARGKKGSVYEEEYLISSVRRLFERTNDVQEEVKRLVSGLLRRGLREQAAKVDEVMTEITSLCEKARSDVWQTDEALPVSEAEPRNTYDINGEGRPSGADGILWDSQQEISGSSKQQAPAVTPWSGNLLTNK